MFVFDAATGQAEALQPDANRTMPPCICKVLGLVHTLVAYGQNLIDTLQQHAATLHLLPCFAVITSIFGTTDLELILTRITRGLLRAAALEDRLRKRAARGWDLTPTPLRLPSPSKPRGATPAVPPSVSPQDPPPEEILTKDRRRPIGAVLVDICLDLGVTPDQMDRATWDELHRDVILYGGDLATLLFGRQRSQLSAHLAASADCDPIPIDGPPIFPEWPIPRAPSPCGRGLGEGAVPVEAPETHPAPQAQPP